MGKIVAITGAGDGLGRALARRLARDGDTVVLLGRTKAKIDAVAAELGDGHLAVQCDVSDPASVTVAFAAIAAQFPKIDVLINNAGVFEPFTLASMQPDQIKTLVDINLCGPIYVAHAALPLLRGGGHIINVTSEAVPIMMPMLWMYGGTKAALEFISDMWMRELEPEDVRVTVVRCGQMMDETKTGSNWPIEVAMQFMAENAKVGINMRERGISHYNSVTDGFRAVLDSPPDVHVPLVWLCSRPAK